MKLSHDTDPHCKHTVLHVLTYCITGFVLFVFYDITCIVCFNFTGMQVTCALRVVHGLGWVGLGRYFKVFGGLGPLQQKY